MKNILIVILTLYYLPIFSQVQDCKLLVTSKKKPPMEITVNGNFSFINGIGDTRSFEIFDSKIYYLKDYNEAKILIYSLDNSYISYIKIDNSKIKYYNEFKIISNNKIALLNNIDDIVYFINFKGDFIRKVKLIHPNDNWQNIKGILYKNELIVSENGNKELIAIDTSNYNTRIFKTLHSLYSLGSIQEVNDTFYIATRKEIYKFTEFGSPTRILELNDYNITSFEVLKEYIFLQTNFGGNIYYYNLKTKNLTNIKSGLEEYKLNELSVIDKKCLDIVNTANNGGQTNIFMVYPNPANSEIIIKYSNFNNNRYNFSLVNSTGTEIFNAWNSRKICLNSVKSGFYNLIIRNQKGNVIKIDKIIVTQYNTYH